MYVLVERSPALSTTSWAKRVQIDLDIPFSFQNSCAFKAPAPIMPSTLDVSLDAARDDKVEMAERRRYRKLTIKLPEGAWGRDAGGKPMQDSPPPRKKQ
jgi:hypothetical protein